MREFQRAAVRLHILHHAADNEVHGAWLTQELSRHGYRVSPGTLYPTLHRLEATACWCPSNGSSTAARAASTGLPRLAGQH